MAVYFAITDADLAAQLARQLGDANRLFAEDEALYAFDGQHFTAARGNWLAAPPAQVWLDGVLANPTSYTLSLAAGTLSFTTPVAGAQVTVSYWFAYYTATDLADLLTLGLGAVEGRLGAFGQLDDARLPRPLRDPVLRLAHVHALTGLLTGNLDNYLWKIEGRTLDKRSVATAFQTAIKLYEASAETALAWLRPQYLAEGETVVLNVDRGLPPTPFSAFQEPDNLLNLNNN